MPPSAARGVYTSRDAALPVFDLRGGLGAAYARSSEEVVADCGRVRDQFGFAAPAVLAVGRVVVDADVRRGGELDSHRAVREQFGLYELGLGGTEARRVWGGA